MKILILLNGFLYLMSTAIGGLQTIPFIGKHIRLPETLFEFGGALGALMMFLMIMGLVGILMFLV